MFVAVAKAQYIRVLGSCLSDKGAQLFTHSAASLGPSVSWLGGTSGSLMQAEWWAKSSTQRECSAQAARIECKKEESEAKDAADQNPKPVSQLQHLPSLYQQFIHKSRYARWRTDERRRETWAETVGRYFDFMQAHLHQAHGYELSGSERNLLEGAVLRLEVMPSMRALMTAGPALDRDHTCAYNCAYLPVNHPSAFDETLYILMSGTGVGFSVERQYTTQLPVVRPLRRLGEGEQEEVVLVEDSKRGWAEALRIFITHLYNGEAPAWDLSGLRPAGARLHTMGGRASGPQPLHDLFCFASQLFDRARGRQLEPLEVHDLMCKIGEVVVSGGVRRSALISLSEVGEVSLREAKAGSWWTHAPHRSLANNSAVYKADPEDQDQSGRPAAGVFMQEWMSLYESKSGERGIFNRAAAEKQVLRSGRRQGGHEWGCNPCSEIILRPFQFCNLTEVVVRSTDTVEELERKVEVAAILGTFQATLVDFEYLSSRWTCNTQEERLLGVSLTGILDHPLLSGQSPTDSSTLPLPSVLRSLRAAAVATNARCSAQLGIPASTAITCVKPSGTVSQLVDAASGVHARHAPYYIRTVRGNNQDPLTGFMRAAGVPWAPCVARPNDTTVFSFPMRSPAGALTRLDLTALQQLDLWLTYQRHWCEHKPSVTISVKEEEWMGVGAWVWEHFEEVSGISFLPFSDHTYAQAPYQDCDEASYNALTESLPQYFSWDGLETFELEDNTKTGQEFACTSGSCELVDIK
mmetsp:Transcript_7402/g.10005  ORF Transcript_7402/g.10005 Transcript_7402/m.10005 type:complete len:750 (+) Transcript_7402:303-2552(+)|eukprot:CAMPEP_0196594122 /NCGR_PEP_ID=MMETSP1081-20130531/77414_1 /TAXON_ID=36882 /ORGANISM="Pyramimonas amylifera, Strain CCMP720" /LENGTH=749 /DNA_ID=CAMNT_0041918293 /DNA_START=328 /DNA_END=2577 /DNA_ORIENTATION=+